MRNRVIIGVWMAAGLLTTAATPPAQAEQEQERPKVELRGSTVEEQRAEMSRFMEKLNADTARHPESAPATQPTEETRPPRPRKPRDSSATTRPAARPSLTADGPAPVASPAAAGEAYRADAPGTRGGDGASPSGPTTQPTPEEFLRTRSADRLPVHSEEDLKALRDKIKHSLSTTAQAIRSATAPAFASPVAPPGSIAVPAGAPTTQPASVLPPPPPPPPPPPSLPLPPSAVASQPSSPHSSPPAPGGVTADAKPEAVPDNQWMLPAEKRTYFFTWRDTDLNVVCEDFAKMADLVPIGLEVIQGAKKVTCRSAKVMDFNQAMNEFNLVLSQQQFWAVRQGKHLVVRKLTDWHRHIPQDRYYGSVEAYREAKLPEWEVVGVSYQCKDASAGRLVEYTVDRLPDNTIRAGVVPGSNLVAFTGPAFFVNQALKHADDMERLASQDPRQMRIYTVENMKPSEISNILRAMVLDTGGGSRMPLPPRPPGAPGAPASGGDSVADDVSIQPQDDTKRLYIRATAEKHAKIEEALAKIDVKRDDDKRVIKEILLKHIRPDAAINIIRPLVTRQRTVAMPIQPQPPQPPPQPGQPPQPPRPVMPMMTTADPDAPELYADTHRSAIIVRCLEDEFAKIEELAAKLDVPASASDARVVPLQYADANQIRDVLQQIVGSRGMRSPGAQMFQAAADPNGTAVILSGEPEDMTKAETLIKQLDVKRDEHAKDYVVKLKNAEPQALASILQQKFSSGGGGSSYSPWRRRWGGDGGGGGGGLPRFIPDDASGHLLVTATAEQWPDIEALIKQLDSESETKPRSEVYKLAYASAQDVVQTLQQAVLSRGMRRSGYGGGGSQPQFAADERTNSILAVATDEHQKIAKEIIAQLDQPGYDELKEIPLQHADAEFVADRLKDLLNVSETGGGGWGRRYGGGQGTVRIVAEPLSNRLLVAAPPEKLEQARKLAAEIDADYAKAGYEERIFTLQHAETREVMAVLQSLYTNQDRGYSPWGGGSSRSGAIRISEAERSIIVRAPKVKLDKIAELIRTIDTEAAGANEIRSWHLPGTDVTAVARTIEQMFRGDYRSRTRVDCAADDASNMLFVSAPRDQMDRIAQQVEALKTNAPKESSFVIRYFAVAHARPEDVANSIEPLLEAKHAAELSKAGRRARWDAANVRPQVQGDANGKRVMVAATEDLMPLAEQLVREMDVVPEGGEQIVRILQLKKGNAEDLAPVVQDAVSRSSGGGRSRRSFWRRQYGGYDGGGFGGGYWGGSSEPGEVSVTAIPGNNALLLRGPERKVEEAIKFAVQLDSEARPEGPMIKTYVLKYADIFDVEETITGLLGGRSVGGYSDWDSGGTFGSRGSRSRRGGDGITISADYANNTLLVAASYDKFAQIDNLVELKEAMAEQEKIRLAQGGDDPNVVKTKDGVMKTYQLETADAEDIAEQLQKILDDHFGFFEAPDVRAMRYTNSVVITAKVDQLKVAEGHLNTLVKNWQPKTVLLVKQLEGIPPSKMASFLMTYGSGMLKVPPNVRPMRVERPGDNPEEALGEREVRWNTPITTQPASGGTVNTSVRPFVPTTELSRLRAELAAMALVQAATTQPAATGPAPTTQPAPAAKAPASAPVPMARPAAPPPPAPKPSPAARIEAAAATTQPASAPAVAAAPPAPATKPATPPASAPAVAAAPAPPPATQPSAPADVTSAPVSPAVASAPPAPPAPAPTPAQPAPAAAPALTAASPANAAPPRSRSSDPDVMNRVAEAAEALRQSGQPQVMFDDQTGMMIFIGQPKQVEELDALMKSLMEQIGTLPSQSDIRVYRLEYVDVNVAATILEQMFNESAQRPGQQGQRGQPPQQPGQPPQPQQPNQAQGRGRDGGRGEDDRSRGDEGGERSGRGGTGRRGDARDRDRDEGGRGGDAGRGGPRPLLHGDRIRVFPDIRTRTLVIRAHPDDFRQISELLLKIDRPSGNPGIDIRIFQLKNLNAGEVEQALKAILKIDEGGRRRTPRVVAGGMPGAPGAWQSQAAMIEQLQQQILELEGIGEGKLAINPSEQITITSDATTNCVIVSAPDEGMKLIEKLITKLEEQQVPLMIRTFKLEHADVGDVLPELEKLFERSAAGGGRRGGGAGDITPSRIGSVQIAADVRTNQLVIRALKPDFEKIEPVIKELDQKIEGQIVQTFTLEYADVASVAQALQVAYGTAGAGGTKVGKPIRISADASTSTLFVWADETMRAKIAKQVLELDEKAKDRGETHQIMLKQGDAAVVAQKLEAAFGQRGGRGRAQVKIVGDSTSGTLFVTAPAEVFKTIEAAAKVLDTQTQLQFRSFKLQNAFAVEIAEQFKELTLQLGRQLANKPDIKLDILSVIPDPRTNTLFVMGGSATLLLAEQVIKQIDVPPSQPVAQTTSYFYLTKADANSVASTINNLYAQIPGKAVPPPKAYAEPLTNSVFVYATAQQLEQIKANVINPLETVAPGPEREIATHAVTLKYAKVDDVMTTVNSFITQRRAALTASGVQRNILPQDLAFGLSSDTNTNQLFFYCTKKNFEDIQNLIKTLDVETATSQVRQTRVFPIQYADVSTTASAVQSALLKPGQIAERDRVTAIAESATQSVVVTASPENLARAEAIIREMDKETGQTPVSEQIVIKEARAADVTAALTSFFQTTMRASKVTGRLPASVQTIENQNAVLVVAPKSQMDSIKEMIKAFDVKPISEVERKMKSYVLTYVDLGSMITTINRAFTMTGPRNPRDAVDAFGDPGTNTLMVMATEDNHKKVEELIKTVDVRSTAVRKTYPFEIKYAVVDDVYSALSAIFATRRQQVASPVTITQLAGTNKVLVTCTEADQKEISELIATLDVAPVKESVVKVIPLKRISPTEANALLTEFLRKPGSTGRYSPTLMADLRLAVSESANSIVVTGREAQVKDVEEILAMIEAQMPSTTQPTGRQPRVIALQFADPYGVAAAIERAFTKPGQVAEIDKVTASVEGATGSLVVMASEANHERIAALVKEIDTESTLTPATEEVAIKEARASDVAVAINSILSQTRRRIRSTGQLPAQVQAVDATNSLLISATKGEMEGIKGLIAKLDRKPLVERERQMKSYVLQYVDLSSMINTINRAFTATGAQGRNPREAVEAFGDTATNTLMVMATPENHAKVEELIRTVDIPGTGIRKTYPFDIKNAVVDDVYAALTAIYAAKKQKISNPVTIAQLRGTNKILVTCTEADQKEVAELIATLDVPGSAGEVQTVRLRHLSPTEASQMLTEFFRKPGAGRYDPTLLYDLRITASESTSSLIVSGRKEGLDRLRALAEKLDAEAPTEGVRKVKVFTLRYANPAYVANVVTQAYGKPSSRAEIDQITAQPEYTTSALVVSASPKNLELIEKLVAELDKESSNKYDRHIVKLQHAQADDVAAALTSAYQSRRSTQQGERPVTVTSEPNTNTLIVTCTDVEFPGVEELIKTLDVPKSEDVDRQLKTFKLTYVEPSSLASAIQTAFQTTTGRRNPRDNVTATYDYTTGALIVAASKERMAKVEELVKELDQESPNRRPVRILELSNAEAADVANSLTQMFQYGGQRMRQGEYAVKVQHLPGTNRILVQANDAQFSEIKEIVKQLDVADFSKVEQMRVVALNHTDANEVLTIVQEFLRKSGSGSQRGQLAGDVRIAASTTTNAIVVSGSKDQADNVERIIRQLDQEVEGANEPQIIPLKVANASQLQRTLTQAFTDAVRQQKRGKTSPETIPIIIADERSNSLVVRARPSDFRSIRDMIDRMDRETGELSGVKVIAVSEGINVLDLAAQVEKVINAGQQQRARENPGLTPMGITVGADTRTNTLMVSGSPALFPEVERLVANLEKMKPPGGTGVLIVPLKNVRPEDVKRVIDQMQQQRHSRRG